MIKICICGYYYRPEFYKIITRINGKYPAHVVSNKQWGEFDVPAGIPVTQRENTGLEWGAYDFYLKNLWDKDSNVLFLHDDCRFRPVMKNYKFLDPVKTFDAIANLPHDQVYIFESQAKADRNYYIHGRAIKCSARFLDRLLTENNGFTFDEKNTGHTRGPTPKHCRHFNYGDYRFADYIKTINGDDGWRIGSYVILPAIELATRGMFDDEIDGPIDEEKEQR